MSGAVNLASPARSISRCAITGGVGTGKTEELIRRVAALLENGEDPSSIAVFAATRPACHEAASRLSIAAGEKAEGVCIRTMAEQELLMLSTPEAVALTGRSPRVLMKFEQSMLMEDLKTTQVQPHRLSEMLRFFYRSWADLEAMDSAWFYSDEEERVYRTLERHLKFMDAYLPAELARAALDCAAELGRSASVAQFSHVFVDDYQKLSRASQQLAAMIAANSLTVAGDSSSKATALEEFPHPQGLNELVEQHPECTSVHLTESRQARKVAEAANALAGDQDFGANPSSIARYAPEGVFELLTFATPNDELAEIASLVGRLVDDGANPQDIAVVAPKRTWASSLARELASLGVPVSFMSRPSIGGDIRSVQACPEARAFSLIRLVANPHDQAAMRCWCGFGDYLANSSLFASIAENGQKLALGKAAVPREADGKALTLQERERVEDALEQARAILQKIGLLDGERLVRAALREVGADGFLLKGCPLLRIARSLPANASAEAICAKAEEHYLFPDWVGHGVLVGLPEELAGHSRDTVIVAGLVNGFSPAARYFDATAVERDKRPALLAKEITRLYECAGKARRRLVFAHFAGADLVSAERLKLKVHRVRLIDGRRMCEIHPSETIRTITGASFND